MQKDRKGFGWKEQKRWPQVSAGGRREMVIEEIKCMEEERRTVQAVSQPQQGAWTAWEMVVQKKVSWVVGVQRSKVKVTRPFE